MRVGAFRCGVALALLVVSSPAAGAESVHEVQPGETLWQIAARFTGDPHQWPELYRANRDQIKDPSLLYPGQVLSIPDFDGAGSQTEAVPTRAVPQRD